MNAKQGAVLGIVIVLVVIALVASQYGVLLSAPASVTPPPLGSAVHASLGKTVNDGTVALRLNGVSDASDPATSTTWIALNREAWDAGGIYNYSLTPAPGDRYLVANVTVTNVQRAEVPFSYGDFVLISRDNSAYYPNYAVCNASCSASALKNGTLSGRSANELYVLFSVPTAAQPVEFAYAGSSPPVVMSTT